MLHYISIIPTAVSFYSRPIQCFLSGFGESACAKKFADFPRVNNGKSKNESACAQQKHWFADENRPNGYIGPIYAILLMKLGAMHSRSIPFDGPTFTYWNKPSVCVSWVNVAFCKCDRFLKIRQEFFRWVLHSFCRAISSSIILFF